MDEYPRYKISKDGEVFSILYKRILKGSTSERGLKNVTLKNRDGKLKTIGVHRLVALAYISNPKKLREVNHRDGDIKNNKVENLEWVSSSENTKHAYNNGFNPVAIPVIKISRSGKDLKIYINTAEASRNTGISRTSISYSCKTGKTSGGFIWKYLK